MRAVGQQIAKWPLIRTMRSARFRLLVSTVLFADAVIGYLFNAALAFDGWRTHGDFHQNLLAGKLLISGESPYLPLLPAPPDLVLVNEHHILYPPSHFALIFPWLQMPDLLQRSTWLLANMVAVVALLLVLYAGLAPASASEKLFGTAVFLAFNPLRIGVEQGQVQLFVTTFIAVAGFCLLRRRALLGGISLGVAIALKGTAFPLVLFFLWRKGYRLVAVAVATGGAIFASTVALGWLPRWFEWASLVAPVNRGSAMVINQSVNGFWLRILEPQLSGLPIDSPRVQVQAVILVTQALVVVGLVYLVARVAVPEPERFWVQLALVLTVLPTVQAYGLDHHFTQAVVGIPVAVRLVASQRIRPAATVGLVLSLGLVLLSDPVIYFLAHSLPSSAWVGQPLALAASSLLLYAMLLAALALGLGVTRRTPTRSGSSRLTRILP